MADDDLELLRLRARAKAKAEAGGEAASQTSVPEAMMQGLAHESVPVAGSYVDLLRSKLSGRPEAEYRARAQLAASEHPAAYHGAGLAGGIGVGMLLPEIPLLEGAGVIGRVLKAGATGAAQGALSRPEGAESMTPEQDMAARKSQGMWGGALGAGGEATLGSLLRRYTGAGAGKRAAENAYDSLGEGTARDIANGEREAIGQKLLDLGIVGRDFPSRSKIQERTAGAISGAETEKRAIMDRLMQKGAQGPSGDDLLSSIQEGMKSRAEFGPGFTNQEANARLLTGWGNDVSSLGAHTTPEELDLLRQGAQKNINWTQRNAGKFVQSEEDRLRQGFEVSKQAAAREALIKTAGGEGPGLSEQLDIMHRMIPANKMVSESLSPEAQSFHQWLRKNGGLLGLGATGGVGALLQSNAKSQNQDSELGSSLEQLAGLGIVGSLANRNYGPQARATIFNLLKNVTKQPSTTGVSNITSRWIPNENQSQP